MVLGKMNKRIATVLLFVFLTMGFSEYEGIKIPFQKVEKAVSKIWKDRVVNYEKSNFTDSIFINNEIDVFEVREKDSLLGFVVFKRVNSCRSGGCSVDNDEEALSFEFFDYFMITDSKLKVLKVSVHNYQATQGHEIMSQGWLRQFVNYTGKKKLVYGYDIEAISGATVSAKAINNDIYYTLNDMNNRVE